MVTKRSAVMSLAAATLGLATGVAAAGEAQATSYWRTIYYATSTSHCFGVQSKASTAKGRREQVQKCNNGSSQLWRMDFAKYKGSTNTSKLHAGSDTGKCLDGAKTEKVGTDWLLHITKCATSDTQEWKYVSPETGGDWEAQNYKTGLCIAPYKKSNKVGTWMITAKCNSKSSSGQILRSK